MRYTEHSELGDNRLEQLGWNRAVHAHGSAWTRIHQSMCLAKVCQSSCQLLAEVFADTFYGLLSFG
jgi:hypothetical protein